MAPEYYHNHLTYYEANDFLDGYNRRNRHTYEAARMVHGIVGHLFAKNYKLPEFPWDKDKKENRHIPSIEEMELIRSEGEAFAARLNKKATS